MLWEAVVSALVGLVTAWAGVRLAPGRFPALRLTVLTGLTGALLGGLITRWVVGSALPEAPPLVALLVAAAGMSLLLREPVKRPARRPRPA